MRVTFDRDAVAEYEFVNGRKPRGTGGWIFEIVWSDRYGSACFDTVTCDGSFGSAKSEAMSFARRSAPGAAVEALVRVMP